MNIITVKWGDKYSCADVNKLYDSIINMLNWGEHEDSINFYCYKEKKQEGVKINGFSDI